MRTRLPRLRNSCRLPLDIGAWGARPPRSLICAFIDTLVSDGFAVETIRQVLTADGCQVAARTCRSWKQPGRQPAARTLDDAVVVDALLTTRGTPEGLYGRRKMTAHLRRVGRQRHEPALEKVSHHTVDRLMRDLGLFGVRRGKKLRTTSMDSTLWAANGLKLRPAAGGRGRVGGRRA